jgi:hypothetical protein
MRKALILRMIIIAAGIVVAWLTLSLLSAPIVAAEQTLTRDQTVCARANSDGAIASCTRMIADPKVLRKLLASA